MKKNHILALLIYFGSLLGADLFAYLLDNSKMVVLTLNFLLTPLLAVVTIILLKDDLKQIVFQKTKSTGKQSLVVVVKWFLLAIAGFIVISMVMPLFFEPEVDNSMKITQAFPLMMIPFVLIGPILEELIFRRILFVSFTTRCSIVASILLTSTLFAAWHMTLSGFPLIFWLSCIFTYSYYQTNRLIVPIALHILWNLFVSSLTLIGSHYF